MINYINNMLFLVQATVRSFFEDENGDTNIVSMVVLMGVAVLLAIIFRDAIGGMLQRLIQTLEGKVGGAWEQT